MLLSMERANRDHKKNAIMGAEGIGHSFEQEQSAAVLQLTFLDFLILQSVEFQSIRLILQYGTSSCVSKTTESSTDQAFRAASCHRSAASWCALCALILSLVDQDLVVRYEVRPGLTGAFHRRYEGRW